MDYFILSQDRRVKNFIDNSDLKSLKNMNILADRITPISIPVNNEKDNEYGDFINGDTVIVSEKLKVLLEKYDENIFFRPIVFQDVNKRKQSLYWIAVFEELDCLSKESEFNKNGTIKKLVINKELANGYRIFTLKGTMEKLIIITLDLAESILRRGYVGIEIKRTVKEEK